MTLCKYRPQRTYDGQFLIEELDAHGLLKKLDEATAALGEEGLASTSFYAGAYIGFKTLFECAKRDGEVDMWTDFLCEFEKEVQDLQGGEI